MPILGLLIAIAIILFIFVGGGSDKPAPSVNPADAKTVVKKADHDLLLGQVRQQLQLYRSEHGKFPASLDELAIPLPTDMALEYDSSTGEVTVAH